MRKKFLTLLFVVATFNVNAAEHGTRFWKDIVPDMSRMGQPLVEVTHARVVTVELQNLRNFLAGAPHESSVFLRNSTFILSVPMPDGKFENFKVVEYAMMEDGLAQKYPFLKTYIGQGIDDAATTARFDFTPYGFNAQIRSVKGTVLIDPYNQQTDSEYIIYYKQNAVRKNFMDCGFNPNDSELFTAEAKILLEESEYNFKSSSVIGHQLRTYRLALASTGEYTNYHGGTVGSGLSAMVTAMNRVNGIYENEVDIRMILIANNDLLVYTNSATDPYTNNSGGTMLGQNQTTIDNVIGNSNYDIGHVFSTGGGGIASFQVPCVTGQKARGVTGLPSPTGDPFYVDYVAHELGHQWGGSHTFNGSAGSCSGNGSTNSAYEPGSGTTIMAYAGICQGQNTQAFSNDYFHTRSFDQITTYSITGNGNSCAVVLPTGNQGPVIDPHASYTIPYKTAFVLTASASDPDGDTLTYDWEQYDLGPAGHPNSPSGNAPLFRSFSSTLSPVRFFPRIQDLVSGTQIMGEILPSYARDMKFRVTARDNHASGGGVSRSFAPLQISVINTSIPFSVTSPNTNITWFEGNFETVTWDVAGTDVTPISTPEVDIFLSLDGGFTYPETLATNVPNSGSAVVTVPNILTNQARVMVKGAGNIFLDISNSNFTIDDGLIVAEYNLLNAIEIYPNPTEGVINLIISEKLSGKADVELVDITGRIVKSLNYTLSGNKEKLLINFSDIDDGAYFLRMKLSDGEITKRIIKI